MVSSGVPDELPEEVTAKAIRKESRLNNIALVQRLGERLGISALGGMTSSARLTPEGSVSEAKMQRQREKRAAELAASNQVLPIVPGVIFK